LTQQLQIVLFIVKDRDGHAVQSPMEDGVGGVIRRSV
jgi:hypothetical protein